MVHIINIDLLLSLKTAKRVKEYTMMRLTGMIVLLFSLLGINNQAFAQHKQTDPVHWTYKVQAAKDGRYDLVFELRLDQGWHIWSLTPGGDGYQVVPSFTFNTNKAVQLEGNPAESGMLISKEMEGVTGIVNYYSDKVTYTQRVKAKPGSVITGTHQYQVCNDMMCLPPKDLDFSFTIK